MKMQHQPLLVNFTYINQQEWSILLNNQNGEHRVYGIVNKFTHDEFLYDKVFCHSWQALEILKVRANYVIQHTPQILLANHQIDQYNIEMFVQTASFGLEKLIKKTSSESSVIETLETVFGIFEVLTRKFGYFRVNQQMIKITKENSMLVWMNENFGSCYPQIPLGSSSKISDQKTMVCDLLSIFLILGCEKQLEGFRTKVENEKNCSFEKFKIMILNHKKLISRSKDESGKIYHSPDFLKRRTSQTRNREHQKSATQHFSIFLKPSSESRYVTSVNLGVKTPTRSEYSNSSKSNGCKEIQSEKFLGKDLKINYDKNSLGGKKLQHLSNLYQENAKSMLVDFNPSRFEETISLSSNSTDKLHMNEQSIPEVLDMKKKEKNFRESANSLATTAFIGSIASSGKLKFTGFDDHNSSTASLIGVDAKKTLASSFGVKETNKIVSLKENFKVKASKIIEENCEEVMTPHSFIRCDKEAENSYELRESEIERDFGGLLDSENVSMHRHSNDLLELEAEFNDILLG